MPRSCFRRLAAFLLVLALAAPWAAAEEPQFHSTPRATAEPALAGFFTTLWDLLAALWTEASSETDAGCSADPNGRCLDLGGTASSEPDAGCSLDPNGGCGSGT